MENFEIGQKVSWEVGNIKGVGAFLESKGEYSDVVAHTINGRPSGVLLQVKTELLVKI